MTVTSASASSHFVNKGKCPKRPTANALPDAEACLLHHLHTPPPGLHIRKDIWTFRTLVLFDEITPTLKLQPLTCRVFCQQGQVSKCPSVCMRRPDLHLRPPYRVSGRTLGTFGHLLVLVGKLIRHRRDCDLTLEPFC